MVDPELNPVGEMAAGSIQRPEYEPLQGGQDLVDLSLQVCIILATLDMHASDRSALEPTACFATHYP